MIVSNSQVSNVSIPFRGKWFGKDVDEANKALNDARFPSPFGASGLESQISGSSTLKVQMFPSPFGASGLES